VASEVLAAKQALTGLAASERSVCAPGRLFAHGNADLPLSVSHFRKALRGLVQKSAMKKYLQLAAGLTCLVVLVLAALALDPDGPLLSSLGEAIARQGHSDQIEDALCRRREAKWHITEQVIAGQLYFTRPGMRHRRTPGS
jgi:hypothetical protein